MRPERDSRPGTNRAANVSADNLDDPTIQAPTDDPRRKAVA